MTYQIGDNLTLYRGDYSKIREFQFCKTYKGCFWGQGIYLTNSEEIAHSYRTKDSYKYYNGRTPETEVMLVDCKFTTKGEALELAKVEWMRHHWRKLHAGKNVSDAIKFQKFMRDMHFQWLDALESGRIEFQKYNRSIKNPVKQKRLPSFYRECIDEKWCMVTYKTGDLDIGYVTTFKFPRKLFEVNTIKTSGLSERRDVLEILIAKKVGGFEKYASISDLLGTPCWSYRGWRHKDSMLQDMLFSIRSKLRGIFEPYGVMGLEYDGGVNTNGKRHRAFVMWDEEFVNRHKVTRSPGRQY